MSPASPSAAHERAPHRHVLLAVFAGGVLGGALRMLVGELLPSEPGQWPTATLIVNVAGAFVLGWAAAGLLATPDLDPRVRPFVATGFCGALTTFSLLQLEFVELIDEGHGATAVGYAAVTLVCGLLAVVAGQALGRRR